MRAPWQIGQVVRPRGKPTGCMVPAGLRPSQPEGVIMTSPTQALPQANTTPIDQDKLNELLGRAIGDVGATSLATLVLIGDELGLYRGLAAGGAQTSAELARRTNTHERYVREWLN